MSRPWQRRLCPAALLLFVLLHLATSLPYAFYDVSRDNAWRYRAGTFDDAMNVDRASSIVTEGYRRNSVLPRENQQLYLMVTAVTQRLVPGNYDLKTRTAIALRVGNSLFFAASLFLLYACLTRLFAPWISLWLTLTFAFRADDFLRLRGKEDGLCLFLVLAVIWVLLSYLKKPRELKLWLAAWLVGLGGAAKQYPLAMAAFFVPLVFEREARWGKRAMLLLGLWALAGATFFFSNPNFYLGGAGGKTPALELAGFTLSAASTFSGKLAAAASIFVTVFLWRLKDVWAASLILFLVCWAKKRGTGEPALRAFLRYRWWVVGFLAVYYAGSLYKQNAFAGGRYVLVGELVLVVFFGAILSELARMRKEGAALPLAAVLVFSASCGATAFHFNYTRELALMEQDVRMARRSTFDELEEEVRSLPLQHGEVILVNTSKALPKDLPLVQPKKIDAETVRESGARYLVLDREIPAGSPACVRLVRAWDPEPPKSYSSYAQGVSDFFATLRTVARAPASSRLPGTAFHLYDVSRCGALSSPIPR